MQNKMTRRRFVGVVGGCAAAAALVLGLAACGAAPSATQGSGSAEASDAAETVVFTDSAGRDVEVPAHVDKVVPSGHTATQVLITIAPEKLAGLSQELTEEQRVYLGDRVSADLPVLGAAFGAKGDLNKEAVAATGAQLIVDTGEYKEGMKEDLDALQEQLGIPVVFIETKLDEWPAAYRMLGELLGVKDRGEKLAAYCDTAYSEVSQVMDKIPEDQRVRVLYCLGADGTNVIARGSFQANVVDMLANNVAVVDSPSGKGNGNESSLEQIAAWNPDAILFGPDSIYETVSSDPAWQTLPAVQAGAVYKVPTEPYCWLNYPPTINQVLGMQWLARVLYPAQFEGKDGAYDVARSYCKTFYGYDLSQAEYDQLTGASVR